MARYDITRSCGHIETVNISGPQKARPARAEYEATRTCRACYLVERDAAAQTAAAASGLPDLAGSPKQVVWALSLRQEAVAALDQGIASWRGMVAAQASDAQRTLATAALDALIARRATLAADTSAHAWIDADDRHVSAAGIKALARAAMTALPNYDALTAAARA